MKRPSATLDGFTLVELLVVMTILSVLMAMLLPALGKAVDSARQAACMNNLRQISMGFVLYGDNYCGYIPCNHTSSTASLYHGGVCDTDIWLRLLATQLGVGQADILTASTWNINVANTIFFCPAEKRNTGHMLNNTPTMNCCYGLNYRGTVDEQRPRFWKHPAQKILLAGSPGLNSVPHDYVDWPFTCYYWVGIKFRHGTRSNMLFMDQHVRPVDYAEGPPTHQECWKWTLWDR